MEPASLVPRSPRWPTRSNRQCGQDGARLECRRCRSRSRQVGIPHCETGQLGVLARSWQECGVFARRPVRRNSGGFFGKGSSGLERCDWPNARDPERPCRRSNQCGVFARWPARGNGERRQNSAHLECFRFDLQAARLWSGDRHIERPWRRCQQRGVLARRPAGGDGELGQHGARLECCDRPRPHCHE